MSVETESLRELSHSATANLASVVRHSADFSFSQAAFDVGIALAFGAAAFLVFKLRHKRKDLMVPGLVLASGACLGFSALTHLARAWAVLWPSSFGIESYAIVDLWVKGSNFIVAVVLVSAAFKALPWALTLPSQITLREDNARLALQLREREIAGEQRFRLALEASPNAILVVDDQSRITFSNAQTEALFGYSREELSSASLEMLIPHAARRTHSSHVRHFREDPAQRAMGGGREVRGLRKDGREFFAEIALGPFRYEGRLHVIAFIADISARKTAERRIQDQSNELERSNQDLETFAYAASHDLQEPLRGMMGYLQLLQRQFSADLPEKGRHFIEQAAESGNRMKVLMDALLQYSRAGRQFTRESVDVGQLVGEVLADLHASVREAGAEIEKHDLGFALTEPQVLRQIYINLLTNALKFRGETKPHIVLGKLQEAGETVFYVRDNGIGIPTEYQGRLFMLFQRLHARGSYPGSGIGLALVAKAVRSHGGRIWVESAADQGATFYFTLKAKTGEKAEEKIEPSKEPA